MVEICSTVKDKPGIADARLIRIIQDILGTRYEATLTFVGPQRAQKLNKMYRNKTYIPNVLSFPLSKTDGEIYICPPVAKKEAPLHNFSYTDYILYLTIHASLHLKGHDHSDRMDKLEQKYITKYKLKKLTA